MSRITGTTTISIAHVEVAISAFSAAPTLPFGFSTSKLQPDRLNAAPLDISAVQPLETLLFITPPEGH
ncbi:hypothetical protein [Burkholderia sp. MSMB2157WGS]|uniref:hypothetical protein n=1 Tax=Burkholderia sp. MSMB2157WGS TaxID=1637928 RepID=UPI00211DA13D|nr:hypothetical protein [Burkholderia sp. MSMB2157WGS]